MSAERSYAGGDPTRPPLSVDQLEEQQGLAGTPIPDYLAILRRMWPTPADADRTLETLQEMDYAPKGRRDAVLKN